VIDGRRAPRRRAIGLTLVLAASIFAPSTTATAAGDMTPPVGSMEYWAFDATTQLAELRFSYADPESGLDHIAIMCDGGTEISVPYAAKVFWPMHSVAGGCTPTYGEHWIQAQVVNGDGLRSIAVDATIVTGPSLHLQISANPTTGHPVTITPVYSSGYTVPSDAECNWEFRWGNTKSLDLLDFDETFGGMYFQAAASSGGCGPWTFTLPYVPVRLFDVRFNGSHARFTAAVGTTERRILSSNLPIAQVLPSTYTPVVGSPITYTRYLLGGATACCGDSWLAQLGHSETPIQWTQNGGSTFTFTPREPGDLLVQWQRTTPSGLLINAYYDPPARYADTTNPVTTAPVQQLGTTYVTTTSVPLALKWTGSDKGWGIKSYQLQRSLNGGTWTSVSLASATSTSVGYAATPGSTLRFRVRATDKSGRIGAWTYGPTFRVVLGSDANAAVHYSGSWTTAAGSSSLGGVSHRTSARGASASYTFSGRDFTWISAKGPTEGKAAIYVNGVLKATIDLYAATPSARRIVYRMHWSTATTRTIKIVNLATSGRPTIDLDGLALLR
jgi:hypothetical protein